MANFLNLLNTAFKLTSTQGKPNAIYSKTTGTGTGEYNDFISPVDGWIYASLQNAPNNQVERIRLYCKWSNMDESSQLLTTTSFSQNIPGSTGVVYIPVLKGMQCGIWAENGLQYNYQFVTDKSAG